MRLMKLLGLLGLLHALTGCGGHPLTTTLRHPASADRIDDNVIVKENRHRGDVPIYVAQLNLREPLASRRGEPVPGAPASQELWTYLAVAPALDDEARLVRFDEQAVCFEVATRFVSLSLPDTTHPVRTDFTNVAAGATSSNGSADTVLHAPLPAREETYDGISTLRTPCAPGTYLNQTDLCTEDNSNLTPIPITVERTLFCVANDNFAGPETTWVQLEIPRYGRFQWDFQAPATSWPAQVAGSPEHVAASRELLGR